MRRADVTFIRRDRYSLQQLTQDGFMTIPPDLAVEVVSPNDYAREVEEKVEEYLRAGVKLIWVVYPAYPHGAGLSRGRNDGPVSR